jgi:single-strand DNA-binding protein
MINKAILLGRVGSIRQNPLPSGQMVTNITLATDKTPWKNKEGVLQKKTIWHNVSLFAGLGDLANKYLEKGHMVYIEGEFDSNKYVGKDGQEKLTMFVIATRVQLLPQGAAKQKTDSQADGANPWAEDHLNDEIPF